MGRLEGKVAIITGSTEGIGEEAARKFAREGAAGVLVVGRNEKRADEVANSIVREGGNAFPCRTDVSNPDDAWNMVATAVKQWGRLDILVNNAAKTSNERDFAAADIDLDDWRKAFEVNTTGPMLCAKYAIPEMIRNGGGSIVNSSSGLGVLADDQWTGYACSKAALGRLSQHIAVAYGAQGIRSNVVVIGLIPTPAQQAMIPDRLCEIMMNNNLLGRVGRPEEIANVMAFLASDESSFITGAEIVADGGHLSHQPHMAQVREWVASLGNVGG